MLHIEAAVAREKIAYVVPIGRHRLSQLSPAGAIYNLHIEAVAYKVEFRENHGPYRAALAREKIAYEVGLGQKSGFRAGARPVHS